MPVLIGLLGAYEQWGVVAIGRDATVTITMPIASTPINIQVTGTGLSSNIPSAYRTKNIARGCFDIQVAAWESDYFWLALCKNCSGDITTQTTLSMSHSQ